MICFFVSLSAFRCEAKNDLQSLKFGCPGQEVRIKGDRINGLFHLLKGLKTYTYVGVITQLLKWVSKKPTYKWDILGL